MPSLHELQAAIGAHLLGADPAALAPLIRADALPFHRRLQVYRNNTFGSLTEALKDTFPVVCCLVDERFFRYAAQEFIRRHPPQAPRLAEYGALFADFLAGFEPARSVAYLPDVARLEWAINEAYHAADAPALDPAAIGAVPQDRYAGLTFIAHPSARLIASAFPVDRIWQAHRPGGDLAAIDLSSGCRLLVDRGADEIRFLSLDDPHLAFLQALFAGHMLQDAYAAAAVAGEFDLMKSLSLHLARGSFTSFVDAS